MSAEEKSSDINSHFSSDVDEKDAIKPYVFLKNLSDKLDSLGVEVTGIERISPYRRSQNIFKQFITVAGLWISGCGGLTSMSSFYLGPMLFGLGLKKTLIAGMLGQFFGCLAAAYCSLMGPRSGCRQMVTARFLFGWWTVKFVAFIGIVGGVGWSVVNCIAGGQILSSVSDGRLPLVASIVILAALSLLNIDWGIRILLKIETFLSIPVLGACLMLYISSASKYKYLSLADSPDEDFATIKGNTLSFFTLCYSITSTWGAVASDYYILFPQDTPNIQIFSLTFFGTFIPTSLVGIIAILTGNIAMNYEPWSEAYESLSMGGVLGAAFEPWGGGGKFLLVLMFLSLVSNNVMNTYSAVFQLQIIALPLARWFRHLYTKELEQVDSDSSALIAAKHCNYNFNIWNSKDRLTQGFAASFAFACGAAGAAIGMSQTYWIGPLAKDVGGLYGGDIAMWLCMGFSGVVYPGLRYWELKTYGR
ncbi:hypothetical protein HF325_002634 [Metschnikowia pulcherrima]|uniref:Uncharacterized protein n=1 Tax=Metschnikowia pulcherrima TaxID=27326 RepID=A0A8H7LCH5_9ASCO|nr:hypothetical protein HF325_002634 [Metschnikowia pulcherrima]